MRISVLGSGSRGNSVLVEAGSTRILVDAGFSGRDLARRLRAVGVEPESVDALVVTHDHRDHTRGIGIFARRFGTPLHCTDATRKACGKLLRGDERVVPYRAGRSFDLGRLRIDPFVTVHDAVEPVALAVVDRESGARLGVATDMGRPTSGVRHALEACDVLILEANHDEVMLQDAPYPVSVKSRIASSHGHLSNHAAARLATELCHSRLGAVVLAHLSRKANTPALARDVVGEALDRVGWRGLLEVAAQDEPTPRIDVERLRLKGGPEQLALL